MEVRKKDLYIPCSCLSEVILLTQYEGEEEVYLTVYKYQSENHSFLTRLKWAWRVLNGRGINTADVILSKENFKKMKKF